MLHTSRQVDNYPLLLGKKGELAPLSSGGSFSIHLKVEGVEVKPSSVAECAEINIADAFLSGCGKKDRGNRWFMYHFEYATGGKDIYAKNGRGIQPRCTPLNIAMCVELAKFFGGEVDYNDCDSRDVNFRAPKQKDLLACNGKAWESLQRRMAAVQPLTKEQIDKYQKYVG